jgi:hypothetical protein
MQLSNANVRFDEISIDGEPISVTVPQTPNSCWLTSLCTAIGPMAREEARRAMHGPELWGALLLSHIMEGIARSLRVDHSVFPEHFLLSTSLYRRSPDRNVRVAERLSGHYPDHAVVLRSLTEPLTEPLAGHSVWPFRVVWIIDDIACDWAPRRDSRRDVKLLENLKLTAQHFTTTIDEARLTRCLDLYRSLYIDTYSHHNPDYTADGIIALMQAGRLELHTLETRDGGVQAFCATHDDGETLTLPLVGYNRARPQADGLYRAIMAHMALWALHRRLKLNLSAGAPHFKRHRGAKPWMEYLLIIDTHLPPWRRLGYRLIARVLRRLEPRIKAIAAG